MMSTMETSGEARIEPEPAPHRCPLWVQYLLISPLRRLLEPPARLLGPHVEPGMTVLEVGCGFGYFSLPLARMVGPAGRVLCVDVEPRAVTRLQRRARAAGLADRIEARVCQPRDLGLADRAGTVDRVAVLHTLHELPDRPGFLAQIRSLLAPRGRVLVVEPRGHVTDEQFADALRSFAGAGFVQVPSPGPPKDRRRHTALLARGR